MMKKRGEASKHFDQWRLALVIYVCIIYGNSLTPAVVSSKGSGYVLGQLQSFLEMVSIDSGWLTEHIVRKSAHFVEYAGLGVLLVLSVKTWIPPVKCRFRGAFELAFVIPFVDETIQLFVPGRSGQVDDVWLDMCGAVVGLTIMTCLMKKFGKGTYKSWRKDSQVKME